jgi:hypothetical protein
MVLSPERAGGLDLKALTRAAIGELGREAGGTPPWIAAIHRNTKHPHVHIVMAARREIAPGRFQTVVINRERLAQMKLAVNAELVRERGGIPARIALRDFGIDVGMQRPRPTRLDLLGSLAYVVDRALYAVAAHQRRELRRWMLEEDRQLRERRERAHVRRELQFER